MANIIGIKSFRLNGVRYPITGNATSILESRSAKTPILDDVTGEVIGFTEEKQAGMLKCDVALTNANDFLALRDAVDAIMVIELINGMVVSGRGLTQIGANEVAFSDGKVSLEFAGNIRIK